MKTKIMEARRRRTKIEKRILRRRAGLHQGVEITSYKEKAFRLYESEIRATSSQETLIANWRQ